MAMRSPTPALEKWLQRVHAEHVSPTAVRVFLQLGSAAPGPDMTKQHIKECAECESLFVALRTGNANDIALDCAFETREGLRQMWAAAERRADEGAAHLGEEFRALRRTSMWIFLGVALLVVLRLWPGLFH